MPQSHTIQSGQLPRYPADDLDGIAAEFCNSGVVMITGALDPAVCGNLILEQWQEILLKQPYTEGHKLKVKARDGRTLHVSLFPGSLWLIGLCSP